MTSREASNHLLLDRYPVLSEVPSHLMTEVLESIHWLRLPTGSTVFDERQACPGFPFVLDGSIRVSKSAPNGRAIALYRVDPGDSCVITTSCLLATSPYNARGVADSDISLGLVPPSLFEQLLRTEPFRRFVFGVFAERISSLMQLVEEVAFRKLDQRLAALLLQRIATAHATHQQLADELGTVREIVSRLLKGFAEQGLVELQRERVTVVDPSALERYAKGSR